MEETNINKEELIRLINYRVSIAQNIDILKRENEKIINNISLVGSDIEKFKEELSFVNKFKSYLNKNKLFHLLGSVLSSSVIFSLFNFISVITQTPIIFSEIVKNTLIATAALGIGSYFLVTNKSRKKFRDLDKNDLAKSINSAVSHYADLKSDYENKKYQIEEKQAEYFATNVRIETLNNLLNPIAYLKDKIEKQTDFIIKPQVVKPKFIDEEDYSDEPKRFTKGKFGNFLGRKNE